MRTLLILLKNIRVYRSIHYSGMVIGGALIAGWVTGLGVSVPVIMTMCLAIILAFQVACVVNDFFDLESDKITNPKRLLVNNKVTSKT